MKGIAELQDRIHGIALDKGWWETERTMGDLIALMHSELSEALEEYRAGRRPDEIYYTCQVVGDDGREVSRFVSSSGDGGDGVLVRPEGVGAQLADCIIRILDFCGRSGLDMETLLLQKVTYNERFSYGRKVI